MKSNTHSYGLTRRLRQSLSLAAALALCAPALAQDLANQPANLLAYWNFNNASNPNQSVATVGGWVGTFMNSTTNPISTYTADGGGFSGQAGDRALDVGTTNSGAYVSVTDIVTALNAGLKSDKVTVSFAQKWHLPVGTGAEGPNGEFNTVSMRWDAPSGGRPWQTHAPWNNNNVYFDTGGRINNATFVTREGWTNWHLMVYIKDGGQKLVQIDGTNAVPASGVPATGATPVPTDISEVKIGGDGSITCLPGLMDDVAIWIGHMTSNQLFKLNSGMTPDQVAVDTDGDGMSDDYEDYWGFDKTLFADGAQDFDIDGLSNTAESVKGTNPKDSDTDDDGLLDGPETGTGTWVSPTDTGTNPFDPDTDDDLLLDGVEDNSGVYASPTKTGTSPLTRDTDYDGFGDGAEVGLGTDPTQWGSQPSLGTGLRLFAYWDFNTNTVATQAVDQINGIVADFPAGLEGTNVTSGVVYTAGGLGRTTNANDRAADFGAISARHAITSTEAAPYLQVAATLDLNAQGGNMTVSFWQKWAGTPVNSSSFWMTSPSTGANAGMQAHVPFGSGGVVFFDNADSAGNERLQGSPPAGFDWQQWHHFAFVKSTTTKEVWIDGVKVLIGSSAKGLQTDITKLFLGARGTDLAQIQGLIDDVAIYGSALTTNQIKALAFGYAPPDIDNAAGDADGDGMPDIYEFNYAFLDANNPADAALDQDVDGSTNLHEYQRNTDPANPDTDNDGLKDGVETLTGTWVSATDTGTDPLNPDTDGDSQKDGVETNTGNYVNAGNIGTSPLGLDYDGDLYPDGTEVLLGSNPTVAGSIPITPGAENLLAYWDFNDASVATESVDKAHGWVGAFEGAAAYTDDGGGFSGKAGDRAVDYGDGTDRSATVRNVFGQWVNACGPIDTITISFWINWHVTPVNNLTFHAFSPSGGSGNRGLGSHTPYSNGNVYWDNNGTGGRLQVGVALTNFPNQWNHFTMTKEANIKEIWMNGELIASSTNINSAIVTDMTQWQIGNSDGISSVVGLMDDVAVWASRLSSNNIVALSLGASPLDFVVPEQPAVLSIERLGDDLVLSWSEPGYTVQTNADLTIPAGWGDVPGATTSPWTNALPADGSGYFRLTK